MNLNERIHVAAWSACFANSLLAIAYEHQAWYSINFRMDGLAVKYNVKVGSYACSNWIASAEAADLAIVQLRGTLSSRRCRTWPLPPRASGGTYHLPSCVC